MVGMTEMTQMSSDMTPRNATGSQSPLAIYSLEQYNISQAFRLKSFT